MKILLLGPKRPEFESFLRSFGDDVARTEDKLTAESNILEGVDWIVSFGYRYILKEDLLTRFSGRVINLHISLLPWNRGADPNLWSILENTPGGVTIHYIDPGIDTGRILAQREVVFDENDTLRTSYDRLSRSIFELFREKWAAIRSEQCESFAQTAGGSFHRARDRKAVEHLLVDGWDTRIADLVGKLETVQ